jgi:V8-like Glu-specific endopeptidase
MLRLRYVGLRASLMLASLLTSVLLSVAMPLSEAHANIIGTDDRTLPPRVEGTLLESVGILKSVPDDGGWGTAFVIGNGCYIMTAYHVAFPLRNGVRPQPSPNVVSEFHVMQNERQFSFKRKYTARPYRWGHVDLDWAILKLDNCNPGDLHPTIVQSMGEGQTIQEPLLPVGYPQDRANEAGMLVQKHCASRLAGETFTYAYTDCDSAGGMSGAPVFVRRRIQGSGPQLVNVVVGMILGSHEAAPNGRASQFSKDVGTIILHMEPVMPWANLL